MTTNTARVERVASAVGFCVPATPANNRAVMDAIKWANRQSEAKRWGCDADELYKGNLVHIDRKFSRFDQYHDDTDAERFRRQFEGETRAQQLANRLAASPASQPNSTADGPYPAQIEDSAGINAGRAS